MSKVARIDFAHYVRTEDRIAFVHYANSDAMIHYDNRGRVIQVTHGPIDIRDIPAWPGDANVEKKQMGEEEISTYQRK